MNILGRVDPPTGYARPEGEVHTAYPKWIHFADKPSVLVQDEAEECKALGGEPPKPVAPAMSTAPVVTLQGANDERDVLLKLAEERGVRIDRRWSVAKISAALSAASPTPSLDVTGQPITAA